MPQYQVKGPDGYTYTIEAPEGTSQAVLQQAIQEQGEAARRQARQRTYGEALGTDTAAALTRGLGAITQFPAQLYALGTGDTETGLYQLGEKIKKYGEGLKSPGLVAREYERARRIEEAEKSGGQLPAFGVAFGETITDPALFSSFITEQLPQLLGPLGAAKIGRVAGAARAAFANASLEEGAKQAARYGTAAAIGTGALQQGADVGAEAFENMYKELVSQGIDPDVAKQTALDRARGVGASALVISTLAQKLPGAKTIEQAMARVPLAREAAKTIQTDAGRRTISRAGETRLGSGIKGLLGESASEMLEEVGGKLAANIAMQTIKPEQSLTAGLGATAALAAIGGGTLGGVLGLLRGPEPEQAAAAPVIQPPAAQPPPPKPTTAQLPSVPPVAPPSVPSEPAKPLTPIEQAKTDLQTVQQQRTAIGAAFDQATEQQAALAATPNVPPDQLSAAAQQVAQLQAQYQSLLDQETSIQETLQKLITESRKTPPTAPPTVTPTAAAPTGAPPPPTTTPATTPVTPPTVTPPTAEILSFTPSGENTEIRLFKNKSGMFGVGVFDKDTQQYLPEMTLWPNEKQAREQYDSQVSKLPRAPSAGETVTPPPQAPAGVTDPALQSRLDAVVKAYRDAGMNDMADQLSSRQTKKPYNETEIAFLEESSRTNIAKQRLIEGAAAGTNAPVEPKLRTKENLYQTPYELESVQEVPNDVTNLVLNKLNDISRQVAQQGIQIEDIDSRFPQPILKFKNQFSELNGQFSRYANQLKGMKRGYKRSELTKFEQAERELGQMLGVDLKPYRPEFKAEPTIQPTEPKAPVSEPSTETKSADKLFDDILDEEMPDQKAESASKLFDAILEEEMPEKAPPAGEGPAAPRTAKEAAASAAKNAAEGFDQAIDGLVELFGGKQKGRLGSGIGFDEETYAKAKPLFQKAVASLGRAVKDIAEAIRIIIQELAKRLNKAQIANLKPYVVRFVEDEVKSEKPPSEPPVENDRVKLAKSFLQTFRDGNGFANINAARQAAGNVLGRKIEPGTSDAKLVDEAVELAGVMYGREVVEKAESTEDIYNRLVEFNNKQMPTLGVRDSVSIANQAYSTPLPLAHAAIELSQLYELGGTILEPTAGQGALLIAAGPQNAFVNEINPDRVAALETQGFKVNQQDAGSMKFQPKAVDVVLTNPPYGEGDQTYNIDGFETKQRDHAIALNALTAMKDDGRAVLLIGGPNRLDEDSRRTAYRGKSKREFFYKLYNEYNVVDHFTVAGDLYAKQGTTYPVDMIVIDGRRANATQRLLPAAALPRLIESWDQLRGVLDGTNIDMGPLRGREEAPGGDTGAEGAAPKPPTAPPTVGGEVEETGGEGRRPRTGAGGEPTTPSGPARGATGEGRGAAPAPSGEPGGERPTGEEEGAGVGTAEGVGEERPGGGGGLQPSELAPVDRAAAAGAPRARLTEEQTQRLQVPYNNFSRNKSVNTLVATNHLTPIEDAFAKLREKVGDIDNYVQNKLQYTSEEFAKAFSAEQVEALALSIYNIESNRGFIIGDQTGIGKGRVVAGMIRYAMLNKKVPVFVTQMPDLYGDIMRDLTDIGMSNVRPLMTNNNASVPLDAEALQWYGEKQEIEADIQEVMENIADVAAIDLGDKFTSLEGDARDKALTAFARTSTNPNVVEMRAQIAELRSSIPERRGKFLETPDLKRHEAALKQMMDNNSLGNYDVIFTTYAQMDPKNSGKPKRNKETGFMQYPKPELFFRHEFLDQFIDDNSMLIMDESHNIGKRSGENQATGRGNIARQYIDKAGSVFYSSATFAKNVDVLDAYNKTDIGMAFPDAPQRLIDALSSIPMQQAVSAMLVKATQYLRRERSYAGISYTNETVEVDQEAAEDLATAMRDIVAFDELKAKSVRNLQADLDTQGEVMEDGSLAAPQVEATNFTSVMHNVLGTFLLSLKSKETADLAIAAIRRGEKPVITVSNTMEMFIKDFAEANNLKVGNVLEASFADVLERYLEKVRTVKISYPDGRKLPHYLTDDELGDEALSAYEDTLEFIRAMGRTLDIPISPIDAIKERIEEAGYSIGEITGRGTVVSTKDGVARLAPRKKSELRTAGKKNTIAKFNEGQIDALIINRSGSTGLSMHASEKFADQRRRVMILAQAEPDINNHVQMLGRINRTGQVTDDGLAPEGLPAVFGLPYYIQLSANVPIELRPAAVLANKMAALSANTTAGRKTATQDVKTPDFMNKYGDRVAAEVVGGSDLNATLGFPVKFDENQNPKVEGAMAKVTGRIGLLPLKEQSALYKQLIEEYNNQIALIESLGQNDLEAQVKQLDAKVLETFELQAQDAGTDSPFTAPVVLQVVDAKRLTKPLKLDQVKELVTKTLNGATPAANRQKQVADFITATNADIETLRQSLPKDASEDSRTVVQKQIDAIQSAQTIFSNRLPRIDQVVSLKSKDGFLFGIVVDVKKKGRTKSASSLSDWEVKFALVNGAAQMMTLRLSQLAGANESESAQADKIVLDNATTMAVPTEDGSGIEEIPIPQAFDRGQLGTRQKRYIITGNLLRGKQAAGGGNLVSYTDDQGNLLQGFLMPIGFDYKKLIAQQAAAITSPQAALELANLGGTVIDKLRMGETFKLTKDKRVPDHYQIEVSKGGIGKQIVKDRDGMYFVSVGNKMRATIVSQEAATNLLIKVLSSSGYNLDLVADIRDRDTKNIIDARNKPTNPPLQNIIPIQPVAQKAKVQTKRRIKYLSKQHSEGIIGDAAFIDGVKTALDKDTAPERAPRVRGADYIKERLLNARRRGLLSNQDVDLASWFIDQNPALVDDLGISIRQTKQEGVAGFYNAIARIINLIPQTETNNTTIHEILHHLERMLPPELQQKIRDRWLMDLTAAARKANTPNEVKFFELLLDFHLNPPEAAVTAQLETVKSMIKNGDVPYDYYQYVNPSEYWAVNATRILENRFEFGETAWGRLRTWLKEFGQKIKSILGLKSDAVIIKAINSLVAGDGKYQSSTLLFEDEQPEQIISTPANRLVTEAQKFLQKRKVLQAEDFEGVDKELFDKLVPIYTPQRATIIDKVAAMKDNFWRRLAQGVADQYRTIREYSERAYMMARMSRTIDGALEGLMFNGQVFLRDGALDIAQNTEGLLEILQPLGKEVDRFLIWMALNREAQLAISGKHSKFEDIDELMERRNELADGELDGQNRRQLYIQVRNKFNVLNRSVLRVAMQQGLIMSTEQEIERTQNRDDLTDEQKAAKIEDLQNNPVGYERFANDIWYIPFYREMEDGMLSGAMDSTGLPNQYFSKNIEGGESPMGDLMENIVRNWSHILSASMKNRASIETLNAAVDQQGAAVNLRAPYVMQGGLVYVRSTGELAGGTGELQGWMTSMGSDTVKVMIKGVPAYFNVLDPLLLESISSIGYMGPQGKFVSVMRDFKNLLQFGVTVSPAFKVRNLFRDSIQAAALSGYLDIYEGWKGTEKTNPRYISALAGGAIFNFGSIVEGDQAALVKRLIKLGVNSDTILNTPDKVQNGIMSLWNKYQDWGNRSEAANRIALYNKLIKNNKDHLEASFMARDLLDFSMQGSWPAFRYLSQIVPFFNARVQGLYKLGRDGISPTVRVFYNTVTGKEMTTPEELEQAEIDKQKARTFTTVTAGVIVASLALYFAFKDDEEYKKRNDWDRDNFWWFKLPNMDYAVRIPKPFEIGAFGTLAERVAEQMFSEGAEGKQLEDSMKRMIWDTFGLNPTPQMFKPLVDLYANKDSFTGAPIESAGLERLSKEERKTDNTSPLAIALGGITNTFLPEKAEISPVQAEYAIKSYFGWLGGTVAWASKYAVAPFKEGAYPDERWTDSISLGFIKTLPSTQSQYVTSFYENARQISQAYADMRHYAAVGDSAKVQQILEDRGDKVALAKMYDKASDQMAQLRQSIRLITEDPVMSGSDKRAQIDTIQLLIIDIAKQAEDLRKATKK